MLKQLKETMSKEIKEIMRTMSHQSENINKKIIFIEYQLFLLNINKKITDLRKVVTKMKNLIEG